MTAAPKRLYSRAAMNDRTTARISSANLTRATTPRAVFASAAAALFVFVAGCGSKEEPAAPVQDIVGILELPVAHRGSPSAPIRRPRRS